VCHAPSNCFFFVSRWNRAIFGCDFSICHSTKRCSSIFDLGPSHPKFTPQNLHKIACKSACTADRPEMFRPTRGFSGWPIQWNRAKCCGADPCWHGNEIWARHGDPVAYRLVVMCYYDTYGKLWYMSIKGRPKFISFSVPKMTSRAGFGHFRLWWKNVFAFSFIFHFPLKFSYFHPKVSN